MLMNLCAAPLGKTRHGSETCQGLNKDTGDRPGYPQARSLAVLASENYLDQILDDPAVAGNAKAIKALMDIKGTLGMIIDTTGSMGGTIDAVKNQVAQIVADVRGTNNEPDEYLLVPFNDPDVGQPFTTADPDAFLAAVNGLTADGGDDCPELSQTGLLRAVGAARSDSSLFLFTDASAKDGQLAGAVNAAAQEKRIKISPLLTGSCSPVDPAYVSNAAQTGGQLFMLTDDELPTAFELVRPQLSGDLVTVLSAQGTLVATTRQFRVPIDSTVTRAVFSVSGDAATMTVRDPSGAAQPVRTLSSGAIATIATPDSGEWTIDVTADGSFSVDVKGNSPLDLNRAAFVELTGRPAHDGYFTVASQPLAGSDQRALAQLIGPPTTGQMFRLLAENGSNLRDVTLATGDPNAAADEFVGSFTLPPEPFRIAVNGVDASGKPFQRVFPRLFRASSVVTRVRGGVPALTPGSTVTVPFEVANLGAEDQFALTAVDNRGFVTAVQPPSVALAKDASAPVDVTLTVPADAQIGSTVQLTFTAASAITAGVENSTSVELTVTAPPAAGQPPVNTAPPKIIRHGRHKYHYLKHSASGPVRVGERLRGDRGTWESPNGSELGFTVQWLRCSGTDDAAPCEPIADATSDRYRVRRRDAGSWLRFAVTAVNDSGQTTAASAPVGPVRRSHCRRCGRHHVAGPRMVSAAAAAAAARTRRAARGLAPGQREHSRPRRR